MSSDIDENIFKFDELAAASSSNQIQKNYETNEKHLV